MLLRFQVHTRRKGVETSVGIELNWLMMAWKCNENRLDDRRESYRRCRYQRRFEKWRSCTCETLEPFPSKNPLRMTGWKTEAGNGTGTKWPEVKLRRHTNKSRSRVGVVLIYARCGVQLDATLSTDVMDGHVDTADALAGSASAGAHWRRVTWISP